MSSRSASLRSAATGSGGRCACVEESVPRHRARAQSEYFTTAAAAALHLAEDHVKPRFRVSSARGGHCHAHDRCSAGRKLLADARQRAGPHTRKGLRMFRKLAVALIAASVFTAPAFAQSTTPAKKDAPAATTPAVHATPSVKHAKRVVHHVRHVKHVKHIKHAKRFKHAKLVKHATHVKHVTHVKKPKHHKVAKITRKGATYMRAVPAHHPVMKTR